MGNFEYCETIVAREYDHFQEVNAFNIASLIHFISLILLSLLFLNKNGLLYQLFQYFGIHLSILPSYFDYIIALIITYFIFALFTGFGGSLRKLPIVLAVETGVNRMFAEGLAFFLMQYGAGFNGLRKATLYASIWGVIVVAMLMMLDRLEKESNGDDRGGYSERSLIGRLIYYSGITIFYIIMLITPIEYIYRRPALKPFAYYQILVGINYIIVVVCLWLEYHLGYCFLFGATAIVEGIGDPIFIFVTLALDSEFWQGIGRNMSSHPLAGVWDLEMDTVATIGQKLSDIEKSSKSYKKLPIIHFGLIELDEHLGYVAGGLSRVYFGKIKKDQVAVKILFAMELTPEVVASFYEEIQILYSLQHPNVITCLGISVMPPAVCVVLEYCKYGSLYDYLYKPIPKLNDITVPLNSIKSIDKSTTELSSLPKRNIENNSIDDVNNINTNINTNINGNVNINSTIYNPSISKRPSRSTTVDEYNFPKRSSKTLDEILAMKRNSRPTDDLSVSYSKKSIQVDGKGFDDNNNVNNNNINNNVNINPLQELNKPTEENIHGTMISTIETRKKSIFERASSVVDSIFGRTPTDRPSFMIDPERYSTSHNDRIKVLMDGKLPNTSNQIIGNNNHQDSIDPSRFSNLSNISTPTSHHSLNLFALSKPKVKLSELRSISIIERFEMIIGACRGLAFLHERGYMHCDLKSPNFLVSNDNVLKLADLGEARPIDTTKTFLSLPNPAINWRPPEMMNPNVSLRFYSTASDVYSLSMVISEILNHEIPLDHIFHNHSVEECYYQIVEWNMRPNIPEFVPDDFRVTLQRAWNKDPYLRPSCHELTLSAERSLILLRSGNNNLNELNMDI